MHDKILFQGDMSENPAAAIAVLNERTTALNREFRDFKEYHKEQLAKIERNQELLSGKLEEVLVAMHEARGGWRTVMLLGGTAATLGGAISWIFTHFAKGP